MTTPRPTLRDQLIWRALVAVDEAAAAAASAPVVPNFALRFALAFLYACAGGGERWMYDSFWRDIQRPSPPDGRQCSRGTEAMASLQGIMRSVGIVPTVATLDALGDHRRRNTPDAIARRHAAITVRQEKAARDAQKAHKRSDCGWM